jgi:cholesterol transport system auxiliary component
MIMNIRTIRNLDYAFVSCVAALCLAGCALTSRSEPMRIRYYTIDATSADRMPTRARDNLELRLGRIDASNHLSEEIAVRNGTHELEYFDDRRWTEKPQEYLRRALAQALFQQRGVTRVFSGPALSLDVELVEFEQVLGDQPRVRMQAIATLRDERRSLFQETFSVERPIAAGGADEAEQAASAFAAALLDVVDKLSERVLASLPQTNNAAADSRSAPANTLNQPTVRAE